MNDKFPKIKFYFDNQLWGIDRIINSVKMGWITQSQYEEITGLTYIVDDGNT